MPLKGRSTGCYAVPNYATVGGMQAVSVGGDDAHLVTGVLTMILIELLSRFIRSD